MPYIFLNHRRRYFFTFLAFYLSFLSVNVKIIFKTNENDDDDELKLNDASSLLCH